MGLLRTPSGLKGSLEAESRQWKPRCGAEPSAWDAGGIRWKALGNPRTLVTCGQDTHRS